MEVLRVRGRGLGALEIDVPESVTSFDAATIEALGAQDVSDLSRVTPNVSIVQTNATQSTFFVRGIGLSDFQSNATSAVSVFQDGVAINAPAIQVGQLFDVDGVEIVKGPQGTGSFRNASAGAIRITSRLPTGNYGGQLRVSPGLIKADGGKGARHALVQDYEGALELPLIEDLLSSRFSFRLRDAEAFKKNGCGRAPPFSERDRGGRIIQRPGDDSGSICGELGGEILPRNKVSRVPVGMPKHIQDEYNWAARGIFRLQPVGSDLDLVLNAHGSRLDQDPAMGQAIGSFQTNSSGLGEEAFTFGGRTSSLYQEPDQAEEFAAICQDTNPGPLVSCAAPGAANTLARRLAVRPLDKRPYRGDYNRHGRLTRDSWGAYARLEAQWFGYDVSVTASYDTYDRLQDVDLDFTPDILFEQVDEDRAWQTYEELRVSGELARLPFEWEFGGYFLYEELDVDARFVLGAPDTQFVQAITRDYFQDTTSFALWASFDWDLYDDLSLEGGIRFNWERKEFGITRQDIARVTTFPGSSSDETTWMTPTGEIALRYYFNEYVSSYVKYARGFKAGHYNAFPGAAQITGAPADEEYNDSWEIGLRGGWLGGRITAAAALFYYRYEGYQLFVFRDDPASPPILEIVNAEEAENYGVEVEGRIEPFRGWVPRFFEGLRISANFAWLHGEFVDFQLIEPESFPPNIIIPISNDFSGNQLQNSPEFSFAVSAEWTFDLGRIGFVIPRYDVSWSDDVFFNPRQGRGLNNPSGSPRLPEFAVGQPAFTIHNFRLAYRTPSQNVEVAFWWRNLTDEVYKIFAADVSKFRGVVVNFLGEPRTVGFDVSVSF